MQSGNMRSRGRAAIFGLICCSYVPLLVPLATHEVQTSDKFANFLSRLWERAGGEGLPQRCEFTYVAMFIQTNHPS